MAAQYLIDTEADSVVTGRKNFNGPSALQRYHQQAVTRLAIVNRTTVDEPGAPQNGQAWLLGPTGTVTGAAWAAAPLNLANNDLVVRSESAWQKITPFDGLELFDLSDGTRVERFSGAWRPSGGGFVGAPLVTEANLASAAHAVNTLGKVDGRVVRVAHPTFAIFRRWVAHGPLATDPWTPVDDMSGVTIITPA